VKKEVNGWKPVTPFKYFGETNNQPIVQHETYGKSTPDGVYAIVIIQDMKTEINKLIVAKNDPLSKSNTKNVICEEIENVNGESLATKLTELFNKY